jgi:hypothetical protein
LRSGSTAAALHKLCITDVGRQISLGMVQNVGNKLYNLSHVAGHMAQPLATCDMRPVTPTR